MNNSLLLFVYPCLRESLPWCLFYLSFSFFFSTIEKTMKLTLYFLLFILINVPNLIVHDSSVHVIRGQRGFGNLFQNAMTFSAVHFCDVLLYTLARQRYIIFPLILFHLKTFLWLHVVFKQLFNTGFAPSTASVGCCQLAQVIISTLMHLMSDVYGAIQMFSKF